MIDDATTTFSAPSAPEAPIFDAVRRATELAILDALRSVVDPEIGMNVVELALIKQIVLGPDTTEVKMILTTPFCTPRRCSSRSRSRPSPSSSTT